MSPRPSALCLASCLLLACSGGDDDVPADDAGAAGAHAGDDAGASGQGGASGSGSAGDAGDIDALKITGRFLLELKPAIPASAERPAKAAFTNLVAQVLDGEKPDGMPLAFLAQEGDCTVYETTTPSCSPKCTNGSVCVADGVCAAYPHGLDVGTATLRGVRTADGADGVDMQPVPPNFTYQLPATPKLAYPPFGEGDALTLDTAGGVLPPLSIRAPGFAPLELPSEDDLVFDPEQATQVRWVPAASPGSHVRVTVDVSHHGGKKGEITCEVEDDGSAEIPASIGAALIALGVSGNPTLEIARESSGRVSVGAGAVSLELSSPITLGLQIPGVVSCSQVGEQDVCPAGQLCQEVHVCG